MHTRIYISTIYTNLESWEFFSVVVVAVFDFFRSRPAWEMFATRPAVKR